MSQHSPFYADVQSHYDLSDDFFALFLDHTRTYSCAYFEHDDDTLEQAQIAKIDLALGKLDIEPGMVLLDIGCGWGSTMLRALDRFDVEVIGLTLSNNQYNYVRSLLAQRPDGHRAEVRLQGWEEYRGKVDRIVTIGAFEHFRYERYADFFDFARAALPASGRMLLHTIVASRREELRDRGIRYEHEDFEFMRFLRQTIFPGGQLPFATGAAPRGVCDFAETAGFTVTRMHSLRSHYARTLDCWSDALRSRRNEAIRLRDEQTYDTYLRYLTGCAHYFRTGHFDIVQFTCAK